MTVESLILLIAGGLLSIIQELVDGWVPWYGNQKPTIKRLITIGLLVVAGAIIFGLSCAGMLGWIDPNMKIACTQEGAIYLLQIVFTLAIGSQITHLLVKKA